MYIYALIWFRSQLAQWAAKVVVWCCRCALVLINEVNLHVCRAQLVLGWVTASRFNSWCVGCISVCNQPPRSTQPGQPSAGSRNVYKSKAMTICGWGVKADMVRVWVAGKTVWSPCYTRAMLHKFTLRYFLLILRRARLVLRKITIRRLESRLGLTLPSAKGCKGHEIPRNGPSLSMRKSSSFFVA